MDDNEVDVRALKVDALGFGNDGLGDSDCIGAGLLAYTHAQHRGFVDFHKTEKVAAIQGYFRNITNAHRHTIEVADNGLADFLHIAVLTVGAHIQVTESTLYVATRSHDVLAPHSGDDVVHGQTAGQQTVTADFNTDLAVH